MIYSKQWKKNINLWKKYIKKKNSHASALKPAPLVVVHVHDYLFYMNKLKRERNDNAPEVFRFTARLYRDSGKAKGGTGIRFDIPKEVRKQLDGMTGVEGTINGHPFRAVMEEGKSGGSYVRVNKAMLGGAHAGDGDTVTLAIPGPEPDPTPPDDLLAPLSASPAARALWNDLSPMGRRDYIRWIQATGNPETRARRIRRTVEELAEGKRRPCCVNVYAYMMSRIQETERDRDS